MRAARPAGDDHAARHAARAPHPRRLHVGARRDGWGSRGLKGAAIPGGLVRTCCAFSVVLLGRLAGEAWGSGCGVWSVRERGERAGGLIAYSHVPCNAWSSCFVFPKCEQSVQGTNRVLVEVDNLMYSEGLQQQDARRKRHDVHVPRVDGPGRTRLRCVPRAHLTAKVRTSSPQLSEASQWCIRAEESPAPTSTGVASRPTTCNGRALSRHHACSIILDVAYSQKKRRAAAFFTV